MPEPIYRNWEEIRVGDNADFNFTITEETIREFAKISGDYNPLHVIEGVPHGMIAGALFSRLLGMQLPGLHCLYLSQTLQFRKRIPANVTLKVIGTVLQKSDATHTLTIETKLKNEGSVLVEGQALVQMI